MEYKNIFWDYDGVIMDSMPVRTEGFRLLFEGYSESQVNKLISYHLENGGWSRYVKIRYFFEEILGEQISDEEVNKWAQKYSVLMLRQLKNPEKLIQDSINFIKKNAKNYNFHIVSGSDGNELREICSALNIDKHFISIHGSPTPKNMLVKNILRDKEYRIEECILIGDSRNDFDAAEDNCIDFSGYNNPKLKDLGRHYISSFEVQNVL